MKLALVCLLYIIPFNRCVDEEEGSSIFSFSGGDADADLNATLITGTQEGIEDRQIRESRVAVLAYCVNGFSVLLGGAILLFAIGKILGTF